MKYEKELNYHNYVRTELIDMLPPFLGWKFLEVGCGTGSTLECLLTRGASYVAGVDIDKISIQTALRRGLNHVLALDVEKDKLPFPNNEFDCIIFADVLEHLYNPWDTLKKLMSYLSDDGYILISIPNIRHYTVLKSLIMNDEWAYSDAGILDESHIRFFTLKETQKLIKYAELHTVMVGRNNSSCRSIRTINKLFLNKLENFITVQYYILARKCDYIKREHT